MQTIKPYVLLSAVALLAGGVALATNPQSGIHNPKLVKPWPREIDALARFEILP